MFNVETHFLIHRMAFLYLKNKQQQQQQQQQTTNNKTKTKKKNTYIIKHRIWSYFCACKYLKSFEQELVKLLDYDMILIL